MNDTTPAPAKGATMTKADIIRRGAHTLSEAEEKLLANAGPLGSSPSNAYNILANADFPFPTVTLTDEKPHKIDQAAFADLRALPNRGDRSSGLPSVVRGNASTCPDGPTSAKWSPASTATVWESALTPTTVPAVIGKAICCPG